MSSTSSTPALSAPVAPPTTAAAQEAEAALEAAYGPSIWEAVEGAKVPDDAWEYHIRKSLNDAAYQNLEYVPYCSVMPVKPTAAPKFMWKRKERH